MFAGNERAVDAVASGHVVMRWIDAAAYEAAIMADPTSMRAMIGALSRQLQELLGLLAGLSNGSASTRVAGTLASLSGASLDGAVERPVTLRLRQQELAELTGLTRATISSCLRDLESQGVLRREYGRLVVLNRRALREAALS